LSDFISHADGSTPLTPEETQGLRLSWALTRGDLDTAEQASILTALTKPKWQRITVAGLLDDLALRALHRDMFGDVWTWAGRYRSSERNIGVRPEQVATGVRDLVADAGYDWRLAAPMGSTRQPSASTTGSSQFIPSPMAMDVMLALLPT
jgi:fido (protein-threonine AMPylation protein)